MAPEGVSHEPVMVEQTLRELLGEGRTRIVDGTVGEGGHAAAILARDPGVRLLGIDLDREVLRVADQRLKAFGDRAILRRGSYADWGSLLKEAGWIAADAVLLDLGVSSFQLDRPDRGFSFREDAALDLRFSREEGQPASELLSQLSVQELADLIWRFGEEPAARAIARAIKEAAPQTTIGLAELVCRVRRTRGGRLHPATKTFQALRIAVNRELENLSAFLRRFHRFLAPRGRAAVISYHSLEDRLVKAGFARLSADGIGTLATRRPIAPAPAEVSRNRRSRSARLRVFEVGVS